MEILLNKVYRFLFPNVKLKFNSYYVELSSLVSFYSRHIGLSYNLDVNIDYVILKTHILGKIVISSILGKTAVFLYPK